MKRSNLAAMVALGLAITAGAAQDAQAVYLDRNGVGEVLVYPYYSVNAGNQTLLAVVNKTAAGKAVKLRFREGRNSRSVLEFNLYLSSFDVWTASVFSLTDTGPNNPANLLTTDNSCTVPRIKGNSFLPMLANGSRYVPFMNYRYTGSDDDAGPNTLDRVREGYFEMIEMGEVTNASNLSLAAISHGFDGIPANCLQVERAWWPLGTGSPELTYWTVDPLTDMAAPTGGLFGTASIVDVLGGTMLTYDAEAIADFSDIVQHVHPTTSDLSLVSAHETNPSNTVAANVFVEGTIVTSRYPASRAIDAVSALFAQDAIFNEFESSAATGAASEWIVTFPTKYAYVDEAIVGTTAVPPFTRVFPLLASAGNSGFAFVNVGPIVFNREEGPNATFCSDPSDPICSPFSPPPQGSSSPGLDWAANVVSFNQPAAVASGSSILGARLVTNVQAADLGVTDGWFSLSLFGWNSNSQISLHRMRADRDGGAWLGLPVIGLRATTYANGQITPGVLSNYSDMAKHRGTNQYVPGTVEGVIFADQFE